VQGQALDFQMSAYPISYAIATLHASMLYRSRGVPYSPNAVLAISLKESALCRGCATLTDGCFQIENDGVVVSTYGALRQYYPDASTPPRRWSWAAALRVLGAGHGVLLAQDPGAAAHAHPRPHRVLHAPP
jgi:hypothetical protein